jgi:DNA transposition AAA+ family ATPase
VKIEIMGTPTMKIVGGSKNVGNEELRLWLEKYIEDHPHLSTVELSRTDHIGASRTALDAYLKGIYFLPKEAGGHGVNPQNTQLEKKIELYREKVEGVVRGGVKNSYLVTRLWQQFQYLVKTAIDEKTIVVGYGKPGVGKSRALQQYKTEMMTTMPIEILCSANITTRYFVQKIATELGLNDRLPTARLEDLIAEKLKKSPRLLFVDQANYLNEKGLGTICYVWEKARIPIVLIGTKDLFNLFMQSSLTEDVRVQLSSRIGWHCPFVDLSVDEVKSIIHSILGSRATNQVVQQIYDMTHGNHRHLEMILPRIAAIVEKNEGELNSGDIQIETLVQKAGRRIMIG